MQKEFCDLFRLLDTLVFSVPGLSVPDSFTAFCAHGGTYNDLAHQFHHGILLRGQSKVLDNFNSIIKPLFNADNLIDLPLLYFDFQQYLEENGDISFLGANFWKNKKNQYLTRINRRAETSPEPSRPEIEQQQQHQQQQLYSLSPSPDPDFNRNHSDNQLTVTNNNNSNNNQQQEQHQQERQLAPVIVSPQQVQQNQQQNQHRVTFLLDTMASNTDVDVSKVIHKGTSLHMDDGIPFDMIHNLNKSNLNNAVRVVFAFSNDRGTTHELIGILISSEPLPLIRFISNQNSQTAGVLIKKGNNANDFSQGDFPFPLEGFIFYDVRYGDKITSTRLESVTNDLASQMNRQQETSSSRAFASPNPQVPQHQNNQSVPNFNNSSSVAMAMASTSQAINNSTNLQFGAQNIIMTAEQHHDQSIANLFGSDVLLATTPVTHWVDALSDLSDIERRYHIDRYFEISLQINPNFAARNTHIATPANNVREAINHLCTAAVNNNLQLKEHFLSSLYTNHFQLVVAAKSAMAAKNKNINFDMRKFMAPYKSQLGNNLLVEAEQATTFNKSNFSHRNKTRGGNFPAKKGVFKKPAGCPDGNCWVCFGEGTNIKYAECTSHQKGNAKAARRE